MNKKLNDLDPTFKPKVFELLARCIENRLQVIIIETLRTPEQQEINITNGVSWTRKSKHLIGKAIDLAPVSVLELKNWAPKHPDWERLGHIGESLGLTWGGRWKVRDCPHFEEA